MVSNDTVFGKLIDSLLDNKHHVLPLDHIRKNYKEAYHITMTMKNEQGIQEMIERMERPSQRDSFMMAVKVAMLKNKEFLAELAK